MAQLKRKNGKKNSEVCISLTIYLEAFRFFFFFCHQTSGGKHSLWAILSSSLYTIKNPFAIIYYFKLLVPKSATISLVELRDAFNAEVPL